MTTPSDPTTTSISETWTTQTGWQLGLADRSPFGSDGHLGSADPSALETARTSILGVIATRPIDLAFEPVIHIQSGSLVGSEALARFRSSAPTSQWVHVAHALGVGNDLELRILAQLIDHLDQAGQTTGFVGVNLSPHALLDPRGDQLLERGSDVDLVVELTAQTAMPDATSLRRRLDAVRALGCSIAIHVSELGVETMRQLRVCEPDVLKLEVALTHAIAAGRVEPTASANFFRYCRHHGVFTVAVGVETDEQLTTLHDVGVDATQGRIHAGLVEDRGLLLAT